jgi:hypothetical protein
VNPSLVGRVSGLCGGGVRRPPRRRCAAASGAAGCGLWGGVLLPVRWGGGRMVRSPGRGMELHEKGREEERNEEKDLVRAVVWGAGPRGCGGRTRPG